MICRKYSSNIIDDKLKKYILRLNNKFIETCKNRYIELNKKDILITDNNTAILKKPNIYTFLLIFSFLSGYHFRCLIEYYKNY